MRDEYWPLADAVARDLTGRADPNELAHVAHYVAEHRDADDFFALLDDLAGPGGAALARGGQTAQQQSAVRDAFQRLRELPAAELPGVVGWAVRLLRYQQSQLPAPRPLPAARIGPPGRPAPRPGGPPAVAGAPAVGGPAAARPFGPPPGRPQPPRPAIPGPGSRPAAAAERGPGGAPPARPPQPGAPSAERGPARPAAQQPPPPPAPRRPPTMDDMLRQLQAQFGGSGRGATESRPPAGRPEPRESKRERLRREQEAIRQRYRQQQEGDEPE